MTLEPVEARFLRFEFKEHKPKTEVWLVKNKHHDDVLGEIRFYAQWRQYCFIVDKYVMEKMIADNNFLIFSRGCFRDIDAFIESLTSKKKKGVK